MPQRRGSADFELPTHDPLRHRRGGHPDLRAGGHPLLAGPQHARPHFQPRPRGVETGLRIRPVHRVHGAARTRPHRPGRHHLPPGHAGLQTRNRRAPVRPGLPERPPGRRPGRTAQGDGDRLRRGHRLRRAPRRTGRAPGVRHGGRTPPGGACGNRRRLPPGACPRPARPVGSPADVLVCTPRYNNRAQRVGRHDPRAPGPAPAAVLRKGAGRRHAHARAGQRAHRLLLDQGQQPPGPAQGRGHRQGKRHLQRLHQREPGRAHPRRATAASAR